MIDFSVVVLPAPLRPSSVTTSPSFTSNVTPCRICDSPYQAWRSLITSSGVLTSSMAHSHVGLANLGMVVHLVIVAFSQHASAREPSNVVGEIGDNRKIMLHHKHGTIGCNALDQMRDAVNVLVTHACGRLVEQQHFRIERQSGGDFQGALAAVW